MKVLDVTLREGEQRSGHSYTVDQKAKAVRKLDALGVDYVQVGFPVADDRTKRVCEAVSVEGQLTGIARAVEKDIVAAEQAGVDVIDLFAPTSDRQREQLLGASREELRETIAEAIDRAHETGREVHFTAMDGFRTDPEFLRTLVAEVEVEYFSIADTVGGQTPRGVIEHLEALGEDLSTVGVHFHDDLGVATANALAAADAGAGKVDVSIAGLGERAGNTALEEFAVAGAVGAEAVEIGIDLRALIPTAQEILTVLNEEVSAQKPILGSGVFEHESGLHTAAMLDDPATFEPFDPSTYGGSRQLLFGPSSGRGATARLLERAGVEASDEAVLALLDILHDVDEDLPLEKAIEVAGELDGR